MNTNPAPTCREAFEKWWAEEGEASWSLQGNAWAAWQAAWNTRAQPTNRDEMSGGLVGDAVAYVRPGDIEVALAQGGGNVWIVATPIRSQLNGDFVVPIYTRSNGNDKGAKA